MSETIKPCPWCKEENIREHSYHNAGLPVDERRMMCIGCGASGPTARGTLSQAIAAWNAAPPPEPARPEPSGKDGEYIQCPHCGGGAFREGIAYTCTRCAMVTAIEPKVEPPLNTPEKLYRDLLNHLGCNGHDGALAEIEALRRHAGLTDAASSDLAEWDAVSASAWDIGEPAVAIPEPAQPYQPRTELVRQLLEIRARILAAGYPPLTLDEINGEAAPRAPEARTCATCYYWHPHQRIKNRGTCQKRVKIHTRNTLGAYFGCAFHEKQGEPRPATGQERQP